MCRSTVFTVFANLVFVTAVACGPTESTEEECAVGSNGCACSAEGTCDDALVCANETCGDVSGDGDRDGGIDGGRDEGVYTETVNPNCAATDLLSLETIPDDPTLNDDDEETVAIFEVDGHNLIGKHVTNVDAAEKGLKLWQEFTTRVPESQLADLAQFEISTDTDPVAYFNRIGDVTTTREGLKIGYSTAAFEQNDRNPCAPLTPRRGTFDWSLVHEFGHLIGWLDGSWPRFLDAFPNAKVDIDGYPEDGSPITTGEFVTSYAARDDGDEDHAETWTTFVMLGDDAIPAPADDEPIALTKLRWMSQQPGYAELRRAIRISEPNVNPVSVPPAPRLADREAWPASISGLGAPVWMQGTWREDPVDGVQVTFTGEDIVLADIVAGVAQDEFSLAAQQEAGMLFYFERHGGRPALAFSYIERASDAYRYNVDFIHLGWDTLIFQQELLNQETLELSNEPSHNLIRVQD